jgi:hypothetical protein
MVRWLLWVLVKHGFVMFGDCWLRVVMVIEVGIECRKERLEWLLGDEAEVVKAVISGD